ncbi:type II secretion system protein N [Chitinimonas sp. JJ19]|uniref:type II secretion system protein N n=1 Tax=Chitinimonas sp. JJ19 TaxID=3109352 RepID=UPI0030022E6A
MKRLSWHWWLLLTLLTTAFLILRLPATVMGSIIAAQTKDKLQLAGAQGSLWHGSAQPLLQGAALGERLDWAWQPKALLKGRLAYQITLDGGQGIVSMGWGGLAVQEANLAVAAAPVFQLDKGVKPYGLSGQLRLASPELRYQAGKPTGTLTLDWLGANSSLAPMVSPLGDYRLTLSPAGEGLRIQLSTLGGRLQLNGGGHWEASQGLAAEVGLQASPGSEAVLSPFLNQVGQGNPGGERMLRFNYR